jgi:hypothetical protein
MEMHVVATDLRDDRSGPYTNQDLQHRAPAIVRKIEPEAEIISRDFGRSMTKGSIAKHTRKLQQVRA